eukprot:ctg_652.g426
MQVLLSPSAPEEPHAGRLPPDADALACSLHALEAMCLRRDAADGGGTRAAAQPAAGAIGASARLWLCEPARHHETGHPVSGAGGASGGRRDRGADAATAAILRIERRCGCRLPDRGGHAADERAAAAAYIAWGNALGGRARGGRRALGAPVDGVSGAVAAGAALCAAAAGRVAVLCGRRSRRSRVHGHHRSGRPTAPTVAARRAGDGGRRAAAPLPSSAGRGAAADGGGGGDGHGDDSDDRVAAGGHVRGS